MFERLLAEGPSAEVVMMAFSADATKRETWLLVRPAVGRVIDVRTQPY